MGHQAQLSSFLAELHRVIERFSTTSPTYPNPVPSIPNPPLQLSSSNLVYATSETAPYHPVKTTPPLNPIPQSAIPPKSRTFTNVIRDSILSQPATRSQINKHLNPPLKPSLKKNHTFIKNRATAKLDRLCTLSKKCSVVCFKCGDTGLNDFLS